jgi:beta-lactamase class A
MIDRRIFMASGLMLAFPAIGAAARSAPRFDDLRSKLGPDGRLGLAALDVGSGRRIAFDAQSRFAMASTFKLALAGAILAKVDEGRLALAHRLPIQTAHLLGHAPVIRTAGAGASLSIEQLCAAIVEVSDNGAANMLLEQIGGPASLTRFFRLCGDQFSRLDRYELALNSNLPGDPRDTTTPGAMVHTMRTLLVDGLLKPESRQRLIAWMIRSSRGLDRIRAGLPGGWKAGSKAGTGARGATNDLVITWPPGRAPVLIACYLDSPNSTDEVRAAVHREVARRIGAAFA